MKTGPVESKKAHFKPTKAGLRGFCGSSAWKYQAPSPVAQQHRLALKKKKVVGTKQTIKNRTMPFTYPGTLTWQASPYGSDVRYSVVSVSTMIPVEEMTEISQNAM
jgi:hypothetical protein